ncbi:MAG: hypothetical protein A2W29_11515 [Gemmatimonadetes bacterium RBG_16_66_8]|nr:MAG: hypothetical protein A2W29_11515 [Gemmatimonadetes bacterium RBG_16_66_8]
MLGYLRRELGFDGVIVSDALIMEGVLRGRGEPGAVVETVALAVHVLRGEQLTLCEPLEDDDVGGPYTVGPGSVGGSRGRDRNRDRKVAHRGTVCGAPLVEGQGLARALRASAFDESDQRTSAGDSCLAWPAA